MILLYQIMGGIIMRYKKLGNTKVDVSVLTIGDTAPIKTGEENNPNAVENAVKTMQSMVEEGVNFIDTAYSYSNGESEIYVGEALKKIDRSKVLINSKFGIIPEASKFRKAGVYHTNCSKEVCFTECEESLKRLGTDYLDTYMPHRFDPNVSIRETFEAMDQLKRRGKIQHIGASNYNTEQLKEAQNYAEIELIEMQYSMLDRSREETLIWAHENHISTMVYGSLGAGILTGRFKELPQFASYDTRLSYHYFKEPMFSKALKIVEVLEQIADQHKVNVSEVAINWTIQKEFVTTAILGATKVEHALANCKALSWTLSKREMDEIDQTIDLYAGRTLNIKDE